MLLTLGHKWIGQWIRQGGSRKKWNYLPLWFGENAWCNGDGQRIALWRIPMNPMVWDSFKNTSVWLIPWLFSLKLCKAVLDFLQLVNLSPTLLPHQVEGFQDRNYTLGNCCCTLLCIALGHILMSTALLSPLRDATIPDRIIS